MTQSPYDDASLIRALAGSVEERIRALKVLAASESAIDDAVVTRILEMAANETTAAESGRPDVVAVTALAGKEERRRAAEVLVRAAANDGRRAMLEAALTGGSTLSRWICAFALARAGHVDGAVLRVAIEALGEADGDVRWAAAEIVCAAESAAEARPLVVAAASSQDATRRKMAIYCMRDLRIADAAVVLDALRSDDAGVRLAALAALAKLAPDDEEVTRKVIVRMRDDSEAGVRRAAAAMLGHLRGDVAAARDALRTEFERSADAHFRRAVSGALDKLKAE